MLSRTSACLQLMMTSKNKQVILVVGMHRSGTSGLTGILSKFGADVPLSATTRISSDNPKGHWEHTELNRINDDVLRQFGMTWAIPGLVNPEQVSKRNGNQINQFLQRTIADSNNNILAFKDPRFCLTLPIWLEAIESLGHAPCIIFSYRSPNAVASSIQKRNGLGYERGLYLWLEYNLRALTSLKDRNCLKVVFPEWMGSAQALFDGLSDTFDIHWNQPWEDCEESANAFVDFNLVNNQAGATSDTFLGQASAELFSLMNETPANVSEINTQADFVRFQQKTLTVLDSISTLMLDERNLWRKKINDIYYLINRNS